MNGSVRHDTVRVLWDDPVAVFQCPYCPYTANLNHATGKRTVTRPGEPGTLHQGFAGVSSFTAAVAGHPAGQEAGT